MRTADPNEYNSVMEKEFFDGLTVGAKGLKVDAPENIGVSVQRMADATKSGVNAYKEGEKAFSGFNSSDNSMITDQPEGTRRGGIHEINGVRSEIIYEVINGQFVAIDTLKRER